MMRLLGWALAGTWEVHFYGDGKRLSSKHSPGRKKRLRSALCFCTMKFSDPSLFLGGGFRLCWT